MGLQRVGHNWTTFTLTVHILVIKVMSLLFKTLSVCHSSSSKEQASFNFVAAVTVCSDFGAQLPYDSIIPPLGIYPRELKKGTWIDIVHHFKVCMSRWIGNVVFEYNGVYSTLRKRAILICAATWMNFNRIILSEVSWSQKDKYKDFPGDPVVKTQHFHCTGGRVFNPWWGT